MVIKCDSLCAHPSCGDPGTPCQMVICKSCVSAFYPEEEPDLFLEEEAVPGFSYRCPMCRQGEPRRAGEARDTRLRRDWVAALASQDAQDRKHRLKKEATAAAAAAAGWWGGRANGRGKHSDGGGAGGAGGTEGAGAAALSLVGGGAGVGSNARGGSKERHSGRGVAALAEERVLDHTEDDGLEDDVGPAQWERQLRDFKRRIDAGDDQGVRRFELALDGAALKDDLPDNGAPWIFFEQVRYFLFFGHHTRAEPVCPCRVYMYEYARAHVADSNDTCLPFLSLLLCRCVRPRWTR